mmetsp:Transcript_5864/g.11178  ORF Transcript_5864/g.11178 Transcript_5864/m.11178 type:complete len:210 (-) Transcript_5864:1544-2173(-)
MSVVRSHTLHQSCQRAVCSDTKLQGKCVRRLTPSVKTSVWRFSCKSCNKIFLQLRVQRLQRLGCRAVADCLRQLRHLVGHRDVGEGGGVRGGRLQALSSSHCCRRWAPIPIRCVHLVQAFFGLFSNILYLHVQLVEVCACWLKVPIAFPLHVAKVSKSFGPRNISGPVTIAHKRDYISQRPVRVHLRRDVVDEIGQELGELVVDRHGVA